MSCIGRLDGRGGDVGCLSSSVLHESVTGETVPLAVWIRPRFAARRSMAFELLRPPLVTIEGFQAAKRFALGFALICILWSLAGNLVGFTNLVVDGTRQSHAIVDAEKTLSPHELELQLLDRNAFGLVRKPRADLRCEPRTGAWTFVCSFLPTPATSSVRVQFGV